MEELSALITGNDTIWMGELNDTPLGEIWAAQSTNGLVAASLWGDKVRFNKMIRKLLGVDAVYAPEQLEIVTNQLTEYFNKQRRRFEFPIDWSVMTPFQRETLLVVYDIEYGHTRTYGDIARQLGKPKAVRAVGRANATNPMPIIIPCHRVLGADGRLHGYSAPGGVETKAWLLRLEGSWLI